MRRRCPVDELVRSARSLYRLNVVVAALGLLAVFAAIGVAGSAIRLEAASLADIVAACRRIFVPQDLTMLAVLSMGSVSLATLGLAARAVMRRVRAQRRFARTVQVVDRLDVDGVQIAVVEDDRPQAFCAGLLRPDVYLSTGALVALDDAELRAVVAHERHHRTRRDPLRVLVAGVLSEALFFLPALRRLGERYAQLAELAADEAAVERLGERQPLASALLVFGERHHPAEVLGIAPERVDHLLGAPPRWELPVSVLAGATLTIGGLVAIVVGTASASTPGSMGLPVLVAGACGLAMVATPAILGGMLLVLCSRRMGRGDQDAGPIARA